MAQKIIKEYPMLPMPLMRQTVETYYDFQNQRISTDHRILQEAKRLGLDRKTIDPRLVKILDDAFSFEKEIKKILSLEIMRYPIFTQYLSRIQGIGPVLTAGLIAYIRDPARFANPSKLWSYSGLGMVSYCPKCEAPCYIERQYISKQKKKVKAKVLAPLASCQTCGGEVIKIPQRRTKGYQSNWNDKIKSLCWKISTSFVKQKAEKSFYRRLYNEKRIELRRKYPTKIKVNDKTKYNDGHLHNMALRYVAKVFMTNLLRVWRQQNGLPDTLPYIVDNPIDDAPHTLIEPFMDREARLYGEEDPEEERIEEEIAMEQIEQSFEEEEGKESDE